MVFSWGHEPLQQAYAFRGKTVSEHSQASRRVLHGISVGELLIFLRKSTSNTFICGLCWYREICMETNLRWKTRTAQNTHTDYTTWKAQRRRGTSGNQKEEAGPRLATKEAKESPSPLSGERPRAKYRHPFSHLTLEENQPREAQKLLPVRSRSARLSAPEPPHPGVPGGLS